MEVFVRSVKASNNARKIELQRIDGNAFVIQGDFGNGIVSRVTVTTSEWANALSQLEAGAERVRLMGLTIRRSKKEIFAFRKWQWWFYHLINAQQYFVYFPATRGLDLVTVPRLRFELAANIALFV